MNISLIFYPKKLAVTQANLSDESIEIFVLDYKPFRAIEIDVENSVFGGNRSNDQTDWNEKIFGSISRKPDLLLSTVLAHTKSVEDTDFILRSSDNVGNAQLYLTNLIAQNLRSKGIPIDQYIVVEVSEGKYEQYTCTASAEKYYTELYNTFNAFQDNDRMLVFISFVLYCFISLEQYSILQDLCDQFNVHCYKGSQI